MPSRKSRDIGLGTAYSRLRRSTRQASNTKQATIRNRNGIPEVYQEMLAENKALSDDDITSDSRPVKKRKIESDQRSDIDDLFESPPPASPVSSKVQSTHDTPSRPQQIVYDDFENSDESDVEFEDVELDAGNQPGADEDVVPAKSLELDLSKSSLEPPKRIVQRRKPVSKAERDMRLDVHKWHLLSLIGHGLHRNSWFNSEEVHAILKPLVPRRLVRLLHVDESKSLSERNYSFNSGVKEICALWRQNWKTTMPGMRRAYWREDVNASDEADGSEDLEFEDFKNAAHTLRGSRDLGAQLFTALLRSIAIDVRLVFSLQVLPFTGAAKAETSSTSKTKPAYIHAPPQNYGSPAIEASPFTPPSKRIKKPKQIIDSEFPIFWTEILTPNQTWSPLDPVVQNSIAKPKTKFEPALSDKLNNMSYVIAFEEDNSVRDVTRRYTQYYNAKTRKLRVESTKQGEQWYASALSVLRKRHHESRDDLEDDELARRTNTEGMPPNIQDFKNHPVYVLERHMRANEVLRPKREVGKVNVGTAKNGKIESVYRRQDVHLCRSADAWYRRGRDVRVGEQPLKYVIPKSNRGARGISAELSDEEGEGVGLYAEYQTDVYEPPPVVNGQIPKNAYGNLDIYVQSMIPPGAVHISHPLAASAARILNIDFADAVTGFEFKGRQGTAVVQGIVVAQEFIAAVASAIDGLEVLGSEEVQEARSKILLGMWKKMLQALRVRDRIDAEYGTPKTKNKKMKKQVVDDDDDGEDDEDDGDEDDDDDAVYHDNDEDMDSDAEGGGFMPEDEPTEEKVQEQTVNLQILKSRMPAILPEEVARVPIKITRSPHKLKLPSPPSPQDPGNNGNDDLFEDTDGIGDAEIMEGGFLPEDIDTEQYGGGGFVPEDDDGNINTEGGGGFMIDDDDDEDRTAKQTRTTTMRPTSKKNDPLDYLKQDSDPKANIHTDLESLHSDAEEDTALQLAIAESLLAAPTHESDTTTKPDHSAELTKPKIDHEKDETIGNQYQVPTTTEPTPNPATVTDADSPLSATSSMLSHDPNEDDEEPEWLNEALDD